MMAGQLPGTMTLPTVPLWVTGTPGSLGQFAVSPPPSRTTWGSPGSLAASALTGPLSPAPSTRPPPLHRGMAPPLPTQVMSAPNIPATSSGSMPSKMPSSPGLGGGHLPGSATPGALLPPPPSPPPRLGSPSTASSWVAPLSPTRTTSAPSSASLPPRRPPRINAFIDGLKVGQDHSLAAIFDLVDADGDGYASKLDFITAMQRHAAVNQCLLPGVDSSNLMRDEDVFDAVDAVFDTIGGGRQRISWSDFAAYCHRLQAEKTPKARATSLIFELIDRDGDGSVSKLDLISAMQRDPAVDEFILPGVDSSKVLSDVRSFDAVDAIFGRIAGGKRRMTYADFERHFRKSTSAVSPRSRKIREVFDLIDAEGHGSLSKLTFVAAMQQNSTVDDFVLPGADSSQVMSNEWSFDAVDAVFDAIACGKRRIDFADFERYFRKVSVVQPLPRKPIDRGAKRILIIGPGFGREMNPRQGIMVEQAGYQVHWCSNVPNPEQPNFPVAPYLGHIMAEIDWFQPDLLAVASKGGVYAVGMWQMGFWRGPTLLINAHPACKQLPKGVPIVLAHGANDEVYPTGRRELEALIGTGTKNLCFLYYTANSGQLAPGMFTREGDRHNMESLQLRDCLPRLIDSLFCPEGPEVHMVRTWRERLSDSRLAAETWLGYSPERLRRLWASPRRQGQEVQKLFPVSPDREEFGHVVTVFKAVPRETPAYLLYPPAEWDRVRVVRVERVENGAQEENCTQPYFQALRRSFEDQGIEFEPGVHTCWAFHGCDPEAANSIVTDPVAGFQPLASGSRNSALWGCGSYFSRDAQYVAGSHFCGPPAPDGTRQMLMCLLTMGMPCLGDPEHRGVLPYRQKPHRYNSSVDSLSSPEVYVIQHSGAAYPAYLLTFA